MEEINIEPKKRTTGEPSDKYVPFEKLELIPIVWCTHRLQRKVGIDPYSVVYPPTAKSADWIEICYIYTDYHLEIHLDTKKTQNPQIAKWSNLLNEFDYELQFRSGAKMCHLDALSRPPTMVTTDDMLDDVMESFEDLQIRDEEDFVY
ncbi:hypothetical protein QE152_g27814 [Popillia japonica]|uniref:Uncharacterized protein n=1 Tax=Popillia japonica TaxID=7064 RepID=A0AAW1JJF0_POPJA